MKFSWLLMLLLALPVHAADPTEESLLAAWEAIQQNDPKVTVFEKTGEREYRFETTHFPYAGTLAVTDLVVDTLGGAYTDAVGHVQVKLPDAGESLMMDHPYAYSIWQRNNMLYWNDDSGGWIGWDEQQARWQEEIPGEPAYGDWFWIVIMLVFVIVLLWATRKQSRNVRQSLVGQEQALAGQQEALAMMKRSIELHEETNRLLKEISARRD